MAHILVVTHEFDLFARRTRFWRPPTSPYQLFALLRLLGRMGHTWHAVRGPKAERADAAILHVDSTYVDEAYLMLGARYRTAINFRIGDISKRKVSGALLSKDDAWSGPVIVKSDLNHLGKPEATLNRRAAARRRPPPFPNVVPLEYYAVLPSIDAVREEVWSDESRVVERFIPEPDPQGFAMRSWVFAGARERCTRHVASDPMIKGANVVSRTAVDVPAEIRAERARLGFDFGKFDFVMHEGHPVLLDANRTPGNAAALSRFIADGALNLAQGLDALIAGAN